MSNSVYRGRSGQAAFMAHRITGFLVVVFLLLHVVDVSLINASPSLYNEVHQVYGNVFLRLFEVGLLAALLFHSLNGLRIVVFDFFPNAISRQRDMLWFVLFLTTVLTLVGAYVILRPFFVGS